jgi:hypothetical protein
MDIFLKTVMKIFDLFMNRYVGRLFITLMAVVYCYLVWHRGEYHFIVAGGQDYGYLYFNNTHFNWEFWETSKNSFDWLKNYYLISMSIWLPILVSKFLQVSLWNVYLAHTALVPIIILFIYYKISGLFYERSIDRVLPAALMAFNHWRITHVNLGTYAFNELIGYNGNDYFIFILLAVYFFFKKDPVKTGLFLGLSALTHVGQTLIAGPFLILMWPIVHRDSSLRPICIISILLLIGGISEWIMMGNALQNIGNKISPELQWEALLTNGHINYPSLQPERFVLSATVLLAMALLSFGMAEDLRQKLMILIGIGWLLLMYGVYYLGLHFKIMSLVIINPMRFSNFYLFFIFLSAHIPKGKNERIAFISFLMVFFYCEGVFGSNKLLESILLAIGVVSIFALFLYLRQIPKNYKETGVSLISYGFIIWLMFTVPTETFGYWMGREKIEHLKQYEAVNFVQKNLGKENYFIFWGSAPNYHLFRSMTHNSVLDPWRLGEYVYSGSQKIFETENQKIQVLIDDSNLSLIEKRRLVRSRILEPFSEKYAEYYKRVFRIEYVLLGSKIDSVGKTIFDNGTYKINAL